ncbi:MAG: tetratricopeptide repeat protein [Bacteroidales bacterium]
MIKEASYIKSSFWALVILTIVFTGVSGYAIAGPADDTINEANEEYSNGYYDHALELYKSVIDQGFTSSDLYYNIGNTYFKLNRFPESILYYERALVLAPHDDNIRFNLELARKRTIDKIESIPELFYERWFKSLININTADGWGALGIILLFIAVVFAAIFLLSTRRWIRSFSFYFSLILLILSIGSLSMAYLQHNSRTSNRDAIVFDPSVTVKSSPSENSIDLFVIHEGTKVRIYDIMGDWYEVRIASGSQGWIKSSSVEKI